MKPEYQAKPRDEQAEDILRMMAHARKEAKAHVLGGGPLDDVRPVKKRRGWSKASGRPAGFALASPARAYR